ncbi:helix-turn-helix domain-containing protein [Mycoplana rhizolycopersici]|uniref:Helix-turn-helix transcriptional regulator n=1 Tax=Mycoplana rhizolycopersici TaxID=2746702 RepID=A0ABX2QBS9_9HYPH|nr:XRE family transcriptional regulator [Rhizobium rhizolycopersici]NVP54138.1 helix-turn-helix transcriptional regulator [Rhizobium rhizolycopersici]
MSTLADDFDQSLGLRVRTEREARGWSLSDLSERAGVSRAMIHKIERGESSPTAALLGRLCAAFGFSVSTLIARAEAGAERLMRLADQPVWVDPETGYRRRQASPAAAPAELVEVELPAGARVAYPAAAFAFQRQMLRVIQGTLTFVEGETIHRLASGDCLALAAPVDCAFVNDSEETCRYLVILVRGDRG